MSTSLIVTCDKCKNKEEISHFDPKHQVVYNHVCYDLCNTCENLLEEFLGIKKVEEKRNDLPGCFK